jgi:hypothetical protein
MMIIFRSKIERCFMHVECYADYLTTHKAAAAPPTGSCKLGIGAHFSQLLSPAESAAYRITPVTLCSNRSASFLHLNKITKALEDADKTVELRPTWEKVGEVARRFQTFYLMRILTSGAVHLSVRCSVLT